ncbi:MAG: hypothetical protein LBT46_08970 [Planctomycetaceae bacterium]|jgi:hypothetical protein|nr:hypothetical protein [Planctomycetaceae bacterium]
MNWYYYDNNGTKSRLISQQELENLVARGIITRTTRLETEGGHKGLAGQVPGLIFPSVPMPVLPSSPLLDNIRSAFKGWWISGAALFALMMLLCLVPTDDSTKKQLIGKGVGVVTTVYIVSVLIYLALNSPRLFFGWKLYHRLLDTVDVSVRPDSRMTWYDFRSLNVINQLAEPINKTLFLRCKPDKIISSNNFCRWAFCCEMVCWAMYFLMMRIALTATSKGAESAASAAGFFLTVIIIVCFVLETMYFRSCVQGAEQILND